MWAILLLDKTRLNKLFLHKNDLFTILLYGIKYRNYLQNIPLLCTVVSGDFLHFLFFF